MNKSMKFINNKVFIIAELSANHGGDINIFKETIKAAKDAGADAVKLQTYTPDTLTIDCNNSYFKLNSGTIWDGSSLYDLYKNAFTPWEWHKTLMEYANKLGILFFSTPYDNSAVDFLENIDVPLYKIASFEIRDINFVEYVASKHKPIIISTGIASLNDINDSIVACRKVGNNQIILLKCTSSYPANVEDSNLITIRNMKETFNCEVGLSDHTLSIASPIVAVSMGAKVIEKHFILNKSIGSPDAAFSIEPKDFKIMVQSIRDAEKCIGKIDYSLNEKKQINGLIGRSLFVVKDMIKGENFTKENVRSIRPGYGLSPKYLNYVLTRTALTDIKRGTPLSEDLI
jgi:pseudaminic acid synthase